MVSYSMSCHVYRWMIAAKDSAHQVFREISVDCISQTHARWYVYWIATWNTPFSEKSQKVKYRKKWIIPRLQGTPGMGRRRPWVDWTDTGRVF